MEEYDDDIELEEYDDNYEDEDYEDEDYEEEDYEEEDPFCPYARHRRFINECWNGGYN